MHTPEMDAVVGIVALLWFIWVICTLVKAQKEHGDSLPFYHTPIEIDLPSF